MDIVEKGTLTFGHSPDPDDAYMFYGFARDAVHVEAEVRAHAGERAAGAVGSPGALPPMGALPVPRRERWKVAHLLEDIQSLNERALRGELEITAISAHAYPYVADRYAVMRTGVSMGDGYGPLVVSRTPCSMESLRGKRIAIPGAMTTANLVLRLFLPEHEPVPVFFDQIQEAVRAGQVDAGVLIHEGQLTYAADGVVKVADLGVLWQEETGLPLPLGLDVVRRDLGADLGAACSRALRASIEYARSHHDEAIAYALEYGRGLDRKLGDRFVGMYVNDWTLDMGEAGEQALRTLLARGAHAGIVPPVGELVVL